MICYVVDVIILLWENGQPIETVIVLNYLIMCQNYEDHVHLSMKTVFYDSSGIFQLDSVPFHAA